MRVRLLLAGIPKRIYKMIEIGLAAVWAAVKKRVPTILVGVVDKLANSNEKRDQWSSEILKTRNTLEANLGQFVALVRTGAVTINSDGVVAVAMMKSAAESALDDLAHTANKIAESKFDVASVLNEGAKLEVERFEETLSALRNRVVNQTVPVQAGQVDPMTDVRLR